MNFSCPFIRPFIYVIIIIYNAFDFPMTGSQPPSALVAQRQSVARPLIRRAPRPTWGFGAGIKRGNGNNIYTWLVGGLEHFLFFHILGIIIPTE